MKRISPQDIEKVRVQVRLYDAVIDHVVLTRSGRDFKGRCPVHQEKLPSFFVRSNGTFGCFGCGQGGSDAIEFMQKLKSLDVATAAMDLAQRFGISLDEDDYGHSSPVPCRPKPSNDSGEIAISKPNHFAHQEHEIVP